MRAGCREACGFDPHRGHCAFQMGSFAGESCVLQTRRRGSTPRGSTRSVCVQQVRGADQSTSGRLGFVLRFAPVERTPVTYGREPDTALPGRFAKAIAPRGYVGSNPTPSAALMKCPGGETDIIPRLERGVPGSNPGRGTWESVPSELYCTVCAARVSKTEH